MTQLPADPPPGWRTVREPEKLAAMPFYLVFLFYASIVAVAWTGGGTGLMGGAIVVFVFAMWIYAIMQFSKMAEKQRGWWAPVVLYHLASLAIPLCLWLGVRGCSPVLQGELAPTNLLQSTIAAAGLFLCILIYGAARGRLARLRIVPMG